MTRRTLLLALLFGASVAFSSQLLRWQLTAVPEQTMSEVLVLLQDVPRGKTLTAEMLGTRKFLKEALPFGVVSRQDDAVGRVSSVALRKGVLLENTMAPKGTLAGIQGMIPEGKRAFTIRTPNVASGLAGLVQPGDHVDVLLTVDDDDENQDSGGAAVVTLLRDIEVLAVDQQVDGLSATPSSDKPRVRAPAMPTGVKSVTLIALPEEAMRLSLAQKKGTLQLSLRSSGITSAESSISLAAITYNDLLGRSKKTPPVKDTTGDRRPADGPDVQLDKAPDPPALPPIVMYRGNSRSAIGLSEQLGLQHVSWLAPASVSTSSPAALAGR